jgi:hypothetical protein
MNEAEIQGSIRAHASRNEELIRRLRTKGVDLGESRSIELHFWAPSQRDAAMLGRALNEKGFLVLMLAPTNPKDGPQRWNVEVGIRQSIDLTVRREFVEELVRMASEFSSELDGWGTSL